MRDPAARLVGGFLCAVLVHLLLLLFGLPFMAPRAAAVVVPAVLIACGAGVWASRRRFGAFWLSWGAGHAGIMAVYGLS